MNKAATLNLSQFTVNYNYSAPVDSNIWVAPFDCVVTGITARPRVVGSDGSAVTAQIRKCGAGVAPASGTILHSGTIDLKGTADTNQELTLSTTAGALKLNAGDAIAFDPTGTTTAATGVVSITIKRR